MQSNDEQCRAGEWLTAATQEDQIVISGIAGTFPNSINTKHFLENLMNKQDCCIINDKILHPEVPPSIGRILNYDQFDHEFFSASRKQAAYYDNLLKVTLERAFEAVLDAGLHPHDVKGANAGVFVGACDSEVQARNLTMLIPGTQLLAGNIRCMIANRISYELGLNGPSYTCDSACSSGMYAFEDAYRSIREGRCDMAIVCSTNICINEILTSQFYLLGVLNFGTGCRPFDDKATGYTRADAVVAMVLQKRKNANRIYAKVVHSKTNADGYKDVGITFPSSLTQGQLLGDVFREAHIDPASIAFVEAHGTGTRAGDPEELSGLDQFFKPTLERPLLIGSIKGNIGHSEPSSGLCSITKCIYMLNFDTFVPNIHYDSPRKEVPALVEGRMKVVTEAQKLPEESRLIAVNNFGFGGANATVILEKFEKKGEKCKYDLPRLVCFSGRTLDAIRHFQKELGPLSKDISCMRLMNHIFRKPIPHYPYRSYVIFDGPNMNTVDKHCNDSNDVEKEIVLVIGNHNKYSTETVNEFLRFPSFQKTLAEIQSFCDNNGIGINSVKCKSNIPQETLNCVILQLCLINLLSRDLKLELNQAFGCTILAKVVAAFAKKEISMPQVMQTVAVLSNNEIDFEKKLLKVLGKKAVDSLTRNNNFPPTESAKNCIINVDYSSSKSYGLQLVSPAGNLTTLLETIGQLYLEGIDPEVGNLYNDVTFPVGRGTAMISPLIKWKDVKFKYEYMLIEMMCATKIIEIDTSEFKFYEGHVIDDRMLIPATGYLFEVWSMFCCTQGKLIYNSCIVFENVKFLKATHFETSSIFRFRITLHSDGLFEVAENNSILVTGYIRNATQSERAQHYSKHIDMVRQEFVLNTKDAYKELRLRGYNYRAEFRSIHQVGPTGALIKWQENWVTFLDNILQIAILQKDSRNLYVPVGIQRLYIDCASHSKEIRGLEKKDNIYIPVTCDANASTFGSKYVEVRGISARAIQKRRQRRQPILETHKFIPNEFKCGIEESVRINVQLLLDCHPTMNIKVTEMLPVEESHGSVFISSLICNAIADVPVVTADVTVVSSKENLIIDNVTVQSDMTKENVLIVVYSLREIDQAFNGTIEDGFVLYLSPSRDFNDARFVLLTTHQVDEATFVHLMRKKVRLNSEKVIINVSKWEQVESWLQRLKTSMGSAAGKEIVLVAEQAKLNGILGFINCLRREPGGDKTRCIFLMDTDRKFDAKDEFFVKQMDNCLPINILKGGKWGTYRHMLLSNLSQVPCDHVYAHTEQCGDLSSLKWYQGPVSKNDACYRVSYSALNFKDLMLAYGKITADSVSTNRFKQSHVLGFEFSALNSMGEIVCGMGNGAMTNLIPTPSMQAKVPENWSLEDAATVSVVYSTCLYALITQARICNGQSILIHSGCGGVGLAAINICTYYKCNIFVTVGTQEKREYLLKNYPHLKANQIGNSQNKSFKQMIFKETRGKGVDLVLNSLAEDKLRASVDCLARGGIFLEIGKYDLEMNNELPLDFLSRECTYKGIMLDTFMSSNLATDVLRVNIEEGFNKGYIKPLPRTVFSMSELESAFKYMSTGKHIGKILIKIDQEFDKLPGFPRYYCNPKKSYLVFGGLGGFGLELCDWLVLRGAKNLVISSRTGSQTGYQNYRLALWKSYGINLIVSKENVLSEEGCRNILGEASKLAPVGGIFNLAVALRDAILENQTADTMLESYGPKALLTQHLDKLSRQLCPELNKFVVFSSVSCGRGNPGQTNYGYSNSVMERICEKRREDGLPALAVQWGAVGDVGLLEDLQKDSSEIAIGGTLQQKIANCIEVFEMLIQQSEVIVSSIIVAEKFANETADNPAEVVARILGIKNMKLISSHAPLTELGMDSMMGVEIKQILERDFDIVLSANDIRTLTLSKLESITARDLIPIEEAIDDEAALSMIAPTLNLVENKNEILIINEKAPSCILGFVGVEGAPEAFVNVAKYLNTQIQLPNYHLVQGEDDNTIDNIADFAYEMFKDQVSREGSFKILCHSYGCLPALKVAADFERNFGAQGIIGIIDGAPLLITNFLKSIPHDTIGEFEANIFDLIVRKLLPADSSKMNEFQSDLRKMASFSDRYDFLQERIKLFQDHKKQKKIFLGHYFRRFHSVLKYKRTFLNPKLKSKVYLYKPTLKITRISDDYDLGKWCEDLTVNEFDGNHQSILDNQEMLSTLKLDLHL